MILGRLIVAKGMRLRTPVHLRELLEQVNYLLDVLLF
jgi:hypothetical protein